mgnify:CR=1 FL=1|jgi:hypothetical protein
MLKNMFFGRKFGREGKEKAPDASRTEGFWFFHFKSMKYNQC